MDDTFYDAHDELYQHAKFGEDRTTRAGCRCEYVEFVLVFCWSRFSTRSRTLQTLPLIDAAVRHASALANQRVGRLERGTDAMKGYRVAEFGSVRY